MMPWLCVAFTDDMLWFVTEDSSQADSKKRTLIHLTHNNQLLFLLKRSLYACPCLYQTNHKSCLNTHVYPESQIPDKTDWAHRQCIKCMSYCHPAARENGAWDQVQCICMKILPYLLVKIWKTYNFLTFGKLLQIAKVLHAISSMTIPYVQIIVCISVYWS